ncbi:MAG: hypothetical protein NVS1B11_02870 [Terriglobales bacterium]
MHDVNEIARACTLLAAIKRNIPTKFEIAKSWVNDFHSVLDRVERSTGESLQNFRIADTDLYKESLGGNTKTGEVYYSGKILVDRGRFLTKLDAALAHFASGKGAALKPVKDPKKIRKS